MVDVTFVDHDGTRHRVNLAPGTTLMEGARRKGIDGIIAECGGQCGCATCVVQVPDEWAAVLPPAGDLENAMLELSRNFGPSARLSCQIRITDRLDGLVVDVPEEQ